MREIDIRGAVRRGLDCQFGHDGQTLLVEELGLCQGAVRVDIAAVNGLLHGFEIKSQQDTLARLPGQEAIYSRVLDMVHVVAAKDHVATLNDIIPGWWGVVQATSRPGGGVALSVVRHGRRNPSPDALAVAQLLWREEALAALVERGLDDGIRRKPRRFVWEKLAASLTAEEVGVVVRNALRTRSAWRSASLRT